VQVAGGVDIPIAQTLALRVSGLYSDDQGWIRNVVRRDYEPHRKDRAIRGVLKWDATPDLDITAVAQHGWTNNRGDGVEFTQTDGTPEFLSAIAGFPGAIEGRLDRINASASATDKFNKLKSSRYSLTANLALGDYTLTAVTGYARSRENDDQDVDFTPGDYLSRIVNEKGRQFTQELRIASPSDRPFDFIAGALYLDGRLDNRTTIVANYPFGPFPGVNLAGAARTDFVQDTEAVSGFTQLNYKLSDTFSISAGGRFTHEKKKVDLGRDIIVPGLVSLFVFPPYAPFSLGRTENNFDYSAGVQYDLGSDAMIFASYGKGTKSGGFAQSVTLLETAGYAKEIAKTAEIGLKLQDAARRWLFNITAFHTNVDDFQLVTFDGFNFVVGNTDLRSQGVELETYWLPMEGLKLYLNNTYADAKDRRSGDVAALAPKWSGNAGFDYRGSLSGTVDLIVAGSIDYRTRRTYLPDPAASPSSDPFTPVNLSVAVAGQDDSWEVRVIGRNLFNENALNSGNPAPFLPAGNQVGTAERSRTVALQGSLRF
jgi:iron complex outermembrane receptor protein